MKQLSITCTILAFGLSTFCQTTQADYLQRSKSQRRWGNVLTAVGAVGLGLVLLSQAGAGSSGGPSDATGAVIICAASLTGGIVLLTAASKNKKKAAGVSVNLKIETTPAFDIVSINRKMYPAASLKLKL